MVFEQKPIPGFPDYDVTTDGRVWAVPRIGVYNRRKRGGYWLKPRLLRNGYLRVKLFEDGKKHQFCMHRLVLMTFVGPCPAGMECRHLDGNKQNNWLDNLCWGTKSENAHDAIEQGTWPDVRGGKNGNTLLTEDDVQTILDLSAQGASQKWIISLFQVTRKTVWNIVHKKTWAHT